MNKQQAANIARRLEADSLWGARREEIIRRYHDEGLSQADLAIHYGVSQPSMHNVMKRLGIKAKPRWRNGEENGRYIHGMASTLYRNMVKKKACAFCGTTENLCVHHMDGDHMNNKLNNLQVLCSPCHSSHHKKEYWKKRKNAQRQTNLFA